MITLEDSEVKSCDQFLQEFSYTEEGMQKYSQFIADTYQNLSYLGSVSLKKNNINVQVEFLSEHIEDGYTFWSEFRAILTQDNKEVAKVDFRGCANEQPHIFEGYMIRNSDAMAILISNKGDCFEGGYVKEDLRIIKGIKYYDTNIVRSIKEESATEPNLANIIVYAAADDTENNDKTLAPQKSSTANIVLLVVTFILGTTLGYTLGKKRWKSQFPSFK
ncbi:MAG: hypothetical protein Q8P75_01345 [bacterium]|nr:hypothetical protein [bacterium]